jgi:hypothetical protein
LRPPPISTKPEKSLLFAELPLAELSSLGLAASAVPAALNTTATIDASTIIFFDTLSPDP